MSKRNATTVTSTRRAKLASQPAPKSVAAAPTPSVDVAASNAENDSFWSAVHQRADEVIKSDHADSLFEALSAHLDYGADGEERIAESLRASSRLAALVTGILDERPSQGTLFALVEMMGHQMRDASVQLDAIHLFRRATGWAECAAHDQLRLTDGKVAS